MENRLIWGCGNLGWRKQSCRLALSPCPAVTLSGCPLCAERWGLLPSSAGCPQGPPGDVLQKTTQGTAFLLPTPSWIMVTVCRAGGTEQQKAQPSRSLDLAPKCTKHDYFCYFQPVVPAPERCVASTSNPTRSIHTLKAKRPLKHRSAPANVFCQTQKSWNLPRNDTETPWWMSQCQILLLPKAPDTTRSCCAQTHLSSAALHQHSGVS